MTTLAFLVSLYWVEVDTRPYLGAIEGAVGGTLLGGAQWLVLRQYMPQAWRWWVATVLGWSLLGLSSVGPLGWLAPRGAYTVLFRVIYGLSNGMQVGLWMGLVQWTALRQQIYQAWQWVFGSLISWAIALVTGWVVGATLYQATHAFLGEVIGLILAWAIVAGLSGLFMVQLLRDHQWSAARRAHLHVKIKV